MAAILWTSVIAIAPELAATAPEAQASLLGFVNSALDVSKYDGESGPITKMARMYLAAHFASLALLGAGGPITMERAGQLEVEYAIPRGKSEYLSTSYGRAFYQLGRPIARGPVLLNGGS